MAEYACRLMPPGDCESIRREQDAIDVGGKKAHRLLCINGGDVAGTQSVRFPDDRFDRAEAKAWCDDHGGNFEPAGAATVVARPASRPAAPADPELDELVGLARAPLEEE